MSEIYLVRHAQASFGEANYDRLSRLGRQQASWLGEYFRFQNLHFDRIICGDMVRHHETTTGICKAMGADPEDREARPQWNEFDFESLVTVYLRDHPEDRPDRTAPVTGFLRLLRKTMIAWADDLLTGDIPETWAQFEKRVRTGLSMATSEVGRGRKTLVVSSGGAISMAIRQVLAAPRETMIQLNTQTRNSAYSHLFFNQDGIHLSGFNHIPHLDHPDRRTAVTYY